METNGFLFCTFVHAEFWKKIVVVVWKKTIDVDGLKKCDGDPEDQWGVKIIVGREY